MAHVVLGHHAEYSFAKHFLRLARELLLNGALLEPTHPACVPRVLLLDHLLAGELHVRRVDYHYIVTAVSVGLKGWLVLATQNL